MSYFTPACVIFGISAVLFEMYVVLIGRASTITYFNLIGGFVLFSLGIILMNKTAEKTANGK